MNVILTCLTNFQYYILVNIDQLIKLGYKNIIVITEHEFFAYFTPFKDQIQLVDKNDIEDTFQYSNKTCLDKTFRNGFWYLTSQRFFYIYEYMKQYDIKNVVHIENDVLLYYNFETVLLDKIDQEYMYIPFDSYERNIASILFIPNHTIFRKILENYDFTKDDMHNFTHIKRSTQLIKSFPIFPTNQNGSEEQYVSENFEELQYIFDAAAMGQYLGGVDPRNNPNNTIGFINETCVIKYNQYNFVWEKEGDLNKPFLLVHQHKYPIFNLHIHSKNLSKFV